MSGPEKLGPAARMSPTRPLPAVVGVERAIGSVAAACYACRIENSANFGRQKGHKPSGQPQAADLETGTGSVRPLQHRGHGHPPIDQAHETSCRRSKPASKPVVKRTTSQSFASTWWECDSSGSQDAYPSHSHSQLIDVSEHGSSGRAAANEQPASKPVRNATRRIVIV